MTKQLSPLEALHDLFNNPYYIALGRVQGKARFNNNIKIIEKALKALEIINEKPLTLFFVQRTKNYNDYLEFVERDFLTMDIYSRKEFDLIKEVIKSYEL